MAEIPEAFVHVLLFECSSCGCPVPAAVTAGNRNVEEVDAGSVELKCSCGWSGKALGIEARKHWVHNWPTDVLDPY
ncbi:MAG TPA: hypothetical protein VN788_14295 [Verrucomicrobiae bacterium]|nr:hypothetical protein [Verrucomicrobiae bacterium]